MIPVFCPRTGRIGSAMPANDLFWFVAYPDGESGVEDPDDLEVIG